MTTQTLKHETVTLTRDIAAVPKTVFATYTDLDTRSAWAAPEGHEVIYRTASFQVGGIDQYVCGPTGKPDMDGQVRYLDIAQDARLVYVETMTMNTDPVAISLVTWQLDPSDAGTRVTLTSQICSYVGDDMVEGTREGLSMALGNLAAQFTN